MKKKIAVLSLAIAIIAIAVVGGSLAWFNDTDEVTNTFIVGDIDIEQHEKDNDGNAFVQNQTMLPIVNTTAPSTDANYIDKVVTVENTGKNDAYVRTYIAVRSDLASLLTLDFGTLTGWTKDTNTETTATIDGVEHTLVSYTYNPKLLGMTGNTTDTSEALLKGVYLNSNVDVIKNDNGTANFTVDGTAVTTFDINSNTVEVIVATQGVQQSGFSDAATAVNSAFPHSPWYVAPTTP